jgi:hypothetical protein
VNDYLTFYDLEVLGWHRDKPRREDANRDRKEAQHMLASLDYLTRNEDGVFSITAKGLKRLGKK